jgi:hypothetical protein
MCWQLKHGENNTVLCPASSSNLLPFRLCDDDTVWMRGQSDRKLRRDRQNAVLSALFTLRRGHRQQSAFSLGFALHGRNLGSQLSFNASNIHAASARVFFVEPGSMRQSNQALN